MVIAKLVWWMPGQNLWGHYVLVNWRIRRQMHRMMKQLPWDTLQPVALSNKNNHRAPSRTLGEKVLYVKYHKTSLVDIFSFSHRSNMAVSLCILSISPQKTEAKAIYRYAAHIPLETILQIFEKIHPLFKIYCFRWLSIWNSKWGTKWRIRFE